MKIGELHPDRFGGLLLAAVGVFLLREGWQLPFGRLNAPDAGFFPTVLAVLLLLMGLAIFGRSFSTPAPDVEFSSRSWAVVFGAAALFLYAVLLERIGFLICTTAILLMLMKVYGRLTWLQSILIAVPLVAASYFGFKELGVPLPRGIFGLPQ